MNFRRCSNGEFSSSYAFTYSRPAMKSSTRAATRCEVVGQTKDFESGERASGWCVINVGFWQSGSMYVSASVSRRRGSVGLGGMSSESSSNRERTSVVAVGEVRLGIVRPLAFSMVGMKGSCAKGVEKSMPSGAARVGK